MTESVPASVITVEIEGEEVFHFSSADVPPSNDFPGNESDPQFAAKEVQLDKLKYGCGYTGRHDHGALPEQKRGSPHEDTLRFLDQARKAVGDRLNELKQAQPAKQQGN